MDVEAFVDQPRGAASQPLGAGCKHQHLQVARHDHFGPGRRLAQKRGCREIAQDHARALAERGIMRLPQRDCARPGNVRGRLGIAAEARHHHFGPGMAQHRDPPRHRRIGQVVDEIGDPWRAAACLAGRHAMRHGR